jgi:hypothetical protein
VKGTAGDSRLWADQRDGKAQYHDGVCLIAVDPVDRSFATAVGYLKLAAEKGSSDK